MQKKKYGKELTDLDIQSLADGQCQEETEKKRIIEAIMSCPLAMARLDELLRQNGLLKNWWQLIRKD